MANSFNQAILRIRRGADPVEEAGILLGELRDEEKLQLLDGDIDFWQGMALMIPGAQQRPHLLGHIRRLGIPGFRLTDGPRGVVLGESTAFPVPMARGATWDSSLEERIGVAIGAEMRAQGANVFSGITLNLPRNPSWGRAQETYGEDPVLLGEFGAALIRGVHHHGMAIVRHFALNSIENARFTVDVNIDTRTLHEVYLPHFRRAVEEGADGVMTAYNSVNGEWAGQNSMLLDQVLRQLWGFEGVTISDFIFALPNTAASLHAGLDLEGPFRRQRARHLPAELQRGHASWADVDRAAVRILATLLRFYSRDLDPEPSIDVVFSDAHRALAREAAATAIVLLRNEEVHGRPVLPLGVNDTQRVAVIGRLAATANTGGQGSSDVQSPRIVTPLEGITAALPTSRVTFVGDDDPCVVAKAAQLADAAIVVVGNASGDEGEVLGGLMSFEEEVASVMSGAAQGGDRRSLRLRDVDVEIIRAAAAANERTVVVLITAGAILTADWQDSIPGLVIGWYGGSEGGHAIADVLFGNTDAAGRLPYAIPTSESHLPPLDVDATTIAYDQWHGQRLLDRDGYRAAFPLGFGLSYAKFKIDALEISKVDEESFLAHVSVTNTSGRRGRTVVQLYASLDAADFPSRVLVGFVPVWLDAEATGTVLIQGSTRPVHRWTSAGFVPAARTAIIEAGAFAGDPDAIRSHIDLTEISPLHAHGKSIT